MNRRSQLDRYSERVEFHKKIDERVEFHKKIDEARKKKRDFMGDIVIMRTGPNLKVWKNFKNLYDEVDITEIDKIDNSCKIRGNDLVFSKKLPDEFIVTRVRQMKELQLKQ
jgi:pantothenate kinase